jgi:hypothetical protein
LNEDLETFQKSSRSYTNFLREIFPEIVSAKSTIRSKVILFNFLKNYLYNWEGILNITPSFAQTFNYFLPVGIITRSVIIDTATVFYFLNILKINSSNGVLDEKEFLERFENLDYDYLSAMMQLLKDENFEEGEQQRILRLYHDSYSSSFPLFFSVKDGKINFNNRKDAGKQKITIDNIFAELKGMEVLGGFKKAYFIYKYFSQLVHVSSFSHNIIKSSTLNFSLMLEAFTYTLFCSSYVLKTIGVNKKHGEVIDDMIHEFDQFYQDFIKRY